MSWILLSLGAVIFFTTLNILQRVLAVETEHPRAMALIFNATAALIATAIFFIGGTYKRVVLPTEPIAWIGIISAILFYGMFERGRFVAAKLLDASVMTTISNITVLVAFIGSLILYGEKLTTNKLIGSILILGALFLITKISKRKEISRKGVLIGMLVSFILGCAIVLDKMGAQYFNAETYNIIVWTAPILFIYFPHIKFNIMKNEIKRMSWKVIVLAGTNVFGYLLQLKALSIAEATRVLPLIQTSVLFTVLAGIIFLNEKEEITKKLIAGTMALAGTYFLIT